MISQGADQIEEHTAALLAGQELPAGGRLRIPGRGRRDQEETARDTKQVLIVGSSGGQCTQSGQTQNLEERKPKDGKWIWRGCEGPSSGG